MVRDAVALATAQHRYDGGKAFRDHINRLRRSPLSGSASMHELGSAADTLEDNFSDFLTNLQVDAHGKAWNADLETRVIELEQKQLEQQKELCSISDDIGSNLREQINAHQYEIETHIEQYCRVICEELIAEFSNQLEFIVPQASASKDRSEDPAPSKSESSRPDHRTNSGINHVTDDKSVAALRRDIRAAIEEPFDAIRRLDVVVAQHTRQIAMMRVKLEECLWDFRAGESTSDIAISGSTSRASRTGILERIKAGWQVAQILAARGEEDACEEQVPEHRADLHVDTSRNRGQAMSSKSSLHCSFDISCQCRFCCREERALDWNASFGRHADVRAASPSMPMRQTTASIARSQLAGGREAYIRRKFLAHMPDAPKNG